MPTERYAAVSRSEFVTASVMVQCKLDSATCRISWNRTTYGEPSNELDPVEVTVILPFTNAGPADLVREALYQLAEKL